MGTIGNSGEYQDLALSPDGTRVALSNRSGRASNIWLLDLSRGTSTRFTFGSALDSYPVWSPDGSRVIFSTGNELYQKPASGVNDAELLLNPSQARSRAESWSRDGRFLLYGVTGEKTNWDIWVFPLQGNKKPIPFLVTEFREGDTRFSPDNHWVAYDSDESGRYEIYVRSFANELCRDGCRGGYLTHTAPSENRSTKSADGRMATDVARLERKEFTGRKREKREKYT